MTKFLGIALLAAASAIAGTAFAQAEDIYAVSTVLTNSQSLLKGKLTPLRSFTTEDGIAFLTTCSWKDVGEEAGSHWVQWNWYKKGSLVSTDTRRAKFLRAPFHLWTAHPANDFGPGPMQIQVLVDGKVLSSVGFRITN